MSTKGPASAFHDLMKDKDWGSGGPLSSSRQPPTLPTVRSSPALELVFGILVPANISLVQTNSGLNRSVQIYSSHAIYVAFNFLPQVSGKIQSLIYSCNVGSPMQHKVISNFSAIMCIKAKNQIKIKILKRDCDTKNLYKSVFRKKKPLFNTGFTFI